MDIGKSQDGKWWVLRRVFFGRDLASMRESSANLHEWGPFPTQELADLVLAGISDMVREDWQAGLRAVGADPLCVGVYKPEEVTQAAVDMDLEAARLRAKGEKVEEVI